MTDPEIRAALIDRSVVGLTLWGEARGEPVEGKIAVGNVIRNRMTNPSLYRADSPSWKAVCLAVDQFSCWSTKNGGASNYAQVMQQAELIVSDLPLDPVLMECLYLADGIMSGVLQDRSHGATFYCTTSLYHAKPPVWVKNCTPLGAIGSQTFFKER